MTGKTVHKRSVLSIFDKQPSQAFIKIGSKNAELRVGINASLRMHVVGQPKPKEIPWAYIEKIVISKPAEEWNR